MIDAAVLDAMVAAGCTAEQVAAAVKASLVADRDAAGARREADRLRKRRQRDRENTAKSNTASELSRGQTVTDWDAPSPSPVSDKEKSPTPPKEINSSPTPPPQPFLFGAGDGAGDPFEDQFWPIYPNKVGKADARKKFAIALRKVGLGVMLDALRRYAAKTDDRPWLNPSTWLHQERWADLPAIAPRAPPSERISKAEQTGRALRDKLEAKYGSGTGRENGSDLPAPAGLLATGGKAG